MNKKIDKPPDTKKRKAKKPTSISPKEQQQAVRWFANKQDRNSRTAYTNGLKIQIDSRRNGDIHRGALTVNGPNEAFIVLMEKSATLADINTESSNILRAIANDLILLAEELCPSKCNQQE